MNTENVLELAKAVERSGSFDMRNAWTDSWLGTPGDIAGHAELLAIRDGIDLSERPAGTAQIWLGISDSDAEALFEPRHECADFRAEPGDDGWITAAHAAAVLRRFAESGEIDWTLPA